MAADRLTFDANGLIAAVAQDALTGQVRMVGYMNREAFEITLREGRAVFYSRSRKTIWRKGESSGNELKVSDVFVDCDTDTILLLVHPAGPTCHTGAATCFYRRVIDGVLVDERFDATPEMTRLEVELASRKDATAGKSYTRSLLDAGAPKIGEKLREEADELARALEGESDERVASEAADVMYHLMVGLLHRGIAWRAVLAELARRSGVSGLVEKASRGAAKST
jgi:phosphoribosyl-ATP pyrophosphohydrolase/phosphoribosyl-AMP cyclohydrolase